MCSVGKRRGKFERDISHEYGGAAPVGWVGPVPVGHACEGEASPTVLCVSVRSKELSRNLPCGISWQNNGVLSFLISCGLFQSHNGEVFLIFCLF